MENRKFKTKVYVVWQTQQGRTFLFSPAPLSPPSLSALRKRVQFQRVLGHSGRRGISYYSKEYFKFILTDLEDFGDGYLHSPLQSAACQAMGCNAALLVRRIEPEPYFWSWEETWHPELSRKLLMDGYLSLTTVSLSLVRLLYSKRFSTQDQPGWIVKSYNLGKLELQNFSFQICICIHPLHRDVCAPTHSTCSHTCHHSQTLSQSKRERVQWYSGTVLA